MSILLEMYLDFFFFGGGLARAKSLKLFFSNANLSSISYAKYIEIGRLGMMGKCCIETSLIEAANSFRSSCKKLL